MVRQLGHAEAAELLGALALDAVDAHEREAVELHAKSCGACRSELADHREVASLLTAGWVEAPAGLWDRIASSLEETPPPLNLAPVVALRPRPMPVVESARRRGGLKMAMVAAIAAAAAVVTVMSVRIVGDGRRIDQIAGGLRGDDLARAANAALADPDARKVSLRSDDGYLFVDAVMLDDGTGYLVKDNLPALPPDRTYQLWAVVGKETISIGVLGPSPDQVAFRATGAVGALAVSDEVAGGVEASEGTPLAVGLLKS